MELNKIYNMDCLEGMKEIGDRSIDLILCDLPYGVTQNKKDETIPLDRLWTQYKRILKEEGKVVLTSQFPFTLDLILSNRSWFRYDIIWDKVLSSSFLNANRRPLRVHEHILVFYEKHGTYNPQKTAGTPNHSIGKNKKTRNRNYGKYTKVEVDHGNMKYPTSIISFRKPHASKALHPTEKPLDLFKWLIKTYSNPGDLVLDNCMGSGTTAVACKELGRNFIGFEINPEYCNMAEDRVSKVSII